MTEELYKKYRPSVLERVRGQDAAVAMVKNWVARNSVPHAILLSGPSGVGKTTIARILKTLLNCSNIDYVEVNGADDTGIDMVRGIRDKMMAAPFKGSCRIYMIDECHALTKNAQNCLLKALEDTPKHVYFILATTDPTKLLNTIQTRCTEVALKPLSTKHIEDILTYVCKKEKLKISEEVLDKIVKCCEGSARKALVYLDQVMGLEDEEEQLNAITPSSMAAAAFDLWKEFCAPKPQWANVAAVLRELKDDPEGVRRLILACARTSLLKPGSKYAARAYLVIDTFRDNLYDTGAAGLAAQCYELCTGVGR